MKWEPMTLPEKVKAFWEQIPAWLPIGGSVLFAALYVGGYAQRLNDRLDSMESQIKAIQDYIRHEHKKADSNAPDFDLQSSDKKPSETAVW